MSRAPSPTPSNRRRRSSSSPPHSSHPPPLAPSTARAAKRRRVEGTPDALPQGEDPVSGLRFLVLTPSPDAVTESPGRESPDRRQADPAAARRGWLAPHDDDDEPPCRFFWHLLPAVSQLPAQARRGHLEYSLDALLELCCNGNGSLASHLLLVIRPLDADGKPRRIGGQDSWASFVGWLSSDAPDAREEPIVFAAMQRRVAPYNLSQLVYMYNAATSTLPPPASPDYALWGLPSPNTLHQRSPEPWDVIDISTDGEESPQQPEPWDVIDISTDSEESPQQPAPGPEDGSPNPNFPPMSLLHPAVSPTPPQGTAALGLPDDEEAGDKPDDEEAGDKPDDEAAGDESALGQNPDADPSFSRAIETADNPDEHSKAADFYGISMEVVGRFYSGEPISDNDREALTMLGARQMARPDQYFDAYFMLKRIVDPSVDGCFLANEAGYGKTRVMFILTATLRLICLCELHVADHPELHAGGDTGREDCPADFLFWIRCTCRPGSLSQQLARLAQHTKLQSAMPHLLVSPLSLVRQHHARAEEFFKARIEVDGKEYKFVKAISLPESSHREGELNRFRGNVSAVYDLNSCPNRQRPGYLFKGLPGGHKLKHLDVTLEGLFDPSTPLQLESGVDLRLTHATVPDTEPLMLFILSTTVLSQPKTPAWLEPKKTPTEAEMKVKTVLRNDSIKIIKAVMTEWPIGISFSVIFVDEWHQVVGHKAKKNKRLEGLVRMRPAGPFLCYASASVAKQPPTGFKGPLCLIRRSTQSQRNTYKKLDDLQDEADGIHRDLNRLRKDAGKAGTQLPPELAARQAETTRRYREFLGKKAACVSDVMIRRLPSSTVGGACILRGLPPRWEPTVTLKDAQVYLENLDKVARDIRKNLPEDAIEELMCARTVSWHWVSSHIKIVEGYKRLKLASFFPHVLGDRNTYQLELLNAEELYPIVRPVLRHILACCNKSIVTQKRRRQRGQPIHAWSPPDLRDYPDPPPDDETGAQRMQKFHRLHRQVTQASGPGLECYRIEKIFEYFTQEAPRTSFHWDPDHPEHTRPPSKLTPHHGVVFLESPSIALYVAIALQHLARLAEDRLKAKAPDEPVSELPLSVLHLPVDDAFGTIPRDSLTPRDVALAWITQANDTQRTVRVVVSTYNAAGTGLDGLQMAANIIIQPLIPFSTMRGEQAYGRVLRVGQRRRCINLMMTVKRDAQEDVIKQTRSQKAVSEGDGEVGWFMERLLASADS